MNWKKKYEPIKSGNKVKLIKYHKDAGSCTNGGDGCCEKNKYIIGRIYEVTYIDDQTVQLRNRCHFPRYCIEKV